MNKLNNGVYFVSNNHTRLENGHAISADNRGALRGVKILQEPDDPGLYEVSIHLLDESLSNWGDKVQMAPKPMRLLQEDNSKVILRGEGSDYFGNSFSDYGIVLKYRKSQLTDVILKMFDRNVDIIYHNAHKMVAQDSEMQIIVEELLELLIQDHEDGDSLIRESDLKERLENLRSVEVTNQEISSAVDLINSYCNKPAIIEGWIGTGGFMSTSQERSYRTEAPKSFLRELIDLVNI